MTITRDHALAHAPLQPGPDHPLPQAPPGVHEAIEQRRLVLATLERHTPDDRALVPLQRIALRMVCEDVRFLLNEVRNLRHALGELRDDTRIVDAIERGELVATRDVRTVARTLFGDDA